MAPYFIIAFFTLYGVTDDVTGVLLGHQRLFDNNFWFHWDRVEKGTIVFALSSWIGWHAPSPPGSIRDLRYDLTLTSGSTLTLTFTKQKVYHSTRLDRRITTVLEFWLYGTFDGGMSQKSNHDLLVIWDYLGGHRLIWDLKFGCQPLRLVTADILVFSSKL